MTRPFLKSLSAFCVALPLGVQADVVYMEDVIVDSLLLCVGRDCVDGEPDIPSRNGIKIKDNRPSIMFDDTSTATGVPSRDWQLDANEVNGLENFYLTDRTAGTRPFSIEGAAPSHSLYVQDDGRIGMRTFVPQEDLHIVASDGAATIRLEDIFGIQSSWQIGASSGGFIVEDFTNATIPFIIEPDAPTYALTIAPNGYVGLGAETPTAPLEVYSDNAFNFFRITAAGAANASVDITYTGGPLGSGQLRYNIVDGDNQEMSLDANGNMVLDGTLTTAGPTCAGGCDRVLDAGYALPSITEHAEAMLTAGHLPAIGATISHAPVNLSERQGHIINELEHAHLYIAQLHSELRRAEEERADMAARLKALEAR